MTRALELTVSDRLIELRKEGPEKMARKRAPSGDPLTSASQLRTDVKYRTPMDDKGHRWEPGTRHFACGRLIEYTPYYEEGWDILLGPYWVKVDERKGQACAMCFNTQAEKQRAQFIEDMGVSARKFGITPKFPKEKTCHQSPTSHLTKWIPEHRVTSLMA